MTLFQATLFTGLFLIAFGTPYLWHGLKTAPRTQAFPRSQAAAYLLLGTASAWFLYKVLHLSVADFGNYKNILFVIFLITALGSFYYVPDFLAVRGLAALILLSASVLLEAAYMQVSQTRLFLVGFVYFTIVIALILGASPYKLRDFLNWLYNSETRLRMMGGLCTAYGVLLIVVAFSY